MPGAQLPGFGLYLTGLPASGKTTLARAVQEMLSARGIPAAVLDSDELRGVLTPNPAYSPAERDWFYEVLAYIAALLVENRVNVIIAATAPLKSHRRAARTRLPRLIEIYVDCPPAVCRARDPKGLWQKADAGEINTLPGAGYPYEPPDQADLRVDTGRLSSQEAARCILDDLIRRGLVV